MLNDAPGFLSSTLNASLLTNVQSGTLQLSNNGSFSYQPSNTFSGVDFFYYRVFDGITNSPPATALLSVRPVGSLGLTISLARQALASLRHGFPTPGNWTMTNNTLNAGHAACSLIPMRC